jgi:hypothetical protein
MGEGEDLHDDRIKDEIISMANAGCIVIAFHLFLNLNSRTFIVNKSNPTPIKRYPPRAGIE